MADHAHQRLVPTMRRRKDGRRELTHVWKNLPGGERTPSPRPQKVTVRASETPQGSPREQSVVAYDAFRRAKSASGESPPLLPPTFDTVGCQYPSGIVLTFGEPSVTESWDGGRWEGVGGVADIPATFWHPVAEDGTVRVYTEDSIDEGGWEPAAVVAIHGSVPPEVDRRLREAEMAMMYHTINYSSGPFPETWNVSGGSLCGREGQWEVSAEDIDGEYRTRVSELVSSPDGGRWLRSVYTVPVTVQDLYADDPDEANELRGGR